MAETKPQAYITTTVRAYLVDLPRLARVEREVLKANPKAKKSDAIRRLLDIYEATQRKRAAG